MGEDLRGLGPPHCGSGRARFFQFHFRKFHSQRHPFPGEGIEFLVSRELPAHFPHKLRPNELGGAFATLGIAELVKKGRAFGGEWDPHTCNLFSGTRSIAASETRGASSECRTVRS